MSAAIQNLETDHSHILRLIDVMEHITLTVDPDPVHLVWIVELIREFADGLHHAKEEFLLFPLMVEKGYSAEKGPVAVMLYEHKLGRHFVNEMAAGIVKIQEGDAGAVKDVYANMLGYADLLKNHIMKENNVLFPMADNVITDADKEALLHAFAEIDDAKRPGKKSRDFIIRIDTLAGIYSS